MATLDVVIRKVAGREFVEMRNRKPDSELRQVVLCRVQERLDLRQHRVLSEHSTVHTLIEMGDFHLNFQDIHLLQVLLTIHLLHVLLTCYGLALMYQHSS